MKLKDILAISGQQGLFRFVSQGRATIIVEALADGRRNAVPVNAKVNSLADVIIFTQEGETPLYKILRAIADKQGGAAALDIRTAQEDALTDFFASVVPAYDRQKVHLSDIKKVVQWYNILHQHSLLDFEVEENEASGKAAQTPRSSAPKSVQQNAPKASTKAAGAGKILAPRKAV